MKTTGYFDITAEAASPADLDRMMGRGDIQFAVTIPSDFTRRVVRHDDPQILVEADASDPVATGGAVAALASLPAAALAHDLTGALAPPAGAGAAAPFSVVVHRRYNPEGLSAYNIVPGLLGVVLSMTLVMMTALGVTREVGARHDGEPAGHPGAAAGGDGRQARALCGGGPGADHGDPDPGQGGCSTCRCRAAGRRCSAG